MPLPAGTDSRPALEFTTNALAEIMTACFQGYVVSQILTGETFNNRFRRESLDLRASRVVVESGRPVAVVLVARRGWNARIAAMGIVPDRRAIGLGRQLLSEVIEDLRQLGDRHLILEVIESNQSALRLYRGLGFATRRRLIGYRRPSTAGGEVAACPQPAELAEADILLIARRVAEDGVADLPWIMAPESLAAAASPARGYVLADLAYAIVEPAPQPSDLVLRTLVVARDARRRGLGRRMVHALAGAHPGQDLVISANFPEQLVPDFMVRAGFGTTPISQVEMKLNLVA